MNPLSSAETYLQDFHQRQVAVTSAAFAHLPAHSASANYASSHATLTSLVPDVDAPLSVLDLACGDGHLPGLLAARQQARLQQGRVQALAVPDASVDCLVSHMALMLTDDIEQVVRERAA